MSGIKGRTVTPALELTARELEVLVQSRKCTRQQYRWTMSDPTVFARGSSGEFCIGGEFHARVSTELANSIRRLTLQQLVREARDPHMNSLSISRILRYRHSFGPGQVQS